MRDVQSALQLHGSEMLGQLVVDVALLLFISGHSAGGQDRVLGATEWILSDLGNNTRQQLRLFNLLILKSKSDPCVRMGQERLYRSTVCSCPSLHPAVPPRGRMHAGRSVDGNESGYTHWPRCLSNETRFDLSAAPKGS